MTPDELHEAHLRLGLSAARAAKFFRVSDGKTVRRWWSGESAAPGPVILLTEALMQSQAVRNFFSLKLENSTPKSE